MTRAPHGLAVLATVAVLAPQGSHGVDNGLGRTPPMVILLLAAKHPLTGKPRSGVSLITLA